MIDKLTEEEIIAIHWQINRLGGFATCLMNAITNADETNLDKIAMGFPEYVSMYRNYTRTPGWWERVRDKAHSVGIHV